MQGPTRGEGRPNSKVSLRGYAKDGQRWPTFKKNWEKGKRQSLQFVNYSCHGVLTSTLNHHYSGKQKASRNFGVLSLLLLFQIFIFLSHENWCCLATQCQQS